MASTSIFVFHVLLQSRYRFFMLQIHLVKFAESSVRSCIFWAPLKCRKRSFFAFWPQVWRLDAVKSCFASRRLQTFNSEQFIFDFTYLWETLVLNQRWRAHKKLKTAWFHWVTIAFFERFFLPAKVREKFFFRVCCLR